MILSNQVITCVGVYEVCGMHVCLIIPRSLKESQQRTAPMHYCGNMCAS